jgi:hypothetical protein
MFNSISPTRLLGVWFAVIAVAVASSVGMEARLSTSALLLVLGIAPVVVMLFLRAGAPSPTVAEILHSVNVKDGRSDRPVR